MTSAFPRLLTAEAMALLPLARFLVAKVQIKRWRGSLGAIEGKNPAALPAVVDNAANAGPSPHEIARHVERAAGRLPFETKCLPRAIALQWMLRRRGIGARLVIARSIIRRDKDEWHAWVERGGEMLIGHCVRSDYHAVLAIASSPTAHAPVPD